MKVSHQNPVVPPSSQRAAGILTLRRKRGIALVVTLILLSVVTFLAVAFLFLTTREKGAVSTQVDMTAARRAAEAATENARAQVSASLISSNQFYYRMIVSTNYSNPNGFVDGSLSLTNVNYDYLTTGSTNFSIDQRNQNIANLYYSPRPPVFVRTNRNLNMGEFRFYLDLNQNLRFDTNGLMIEMGVRGNALFTVDADGNRIPITNFFVGDPEWVGILERPDRPHSPSNKFVGRWCFIAVPSGKTLDFNTVHNQAKFPAPPTADGFLRNMGVGPWEMNFASFLVDLNTNVWHQNPGGPGLLPKPQIDPAPYFYDTALALRSTGTAFEDAVALTRYRYNGNWNNLKSVRDLFGPRGELAFQLNGADDYSSGPLLLTNTTPPFDGDTATRVTLSWPGAENPNHFFTLQDVFDRTKTTGVGQGPPYNTFRDRLYNAGYFGNGFYDRYTYYRLLSQIGPDSPPDPTLANKINLNYINVDTNGQVVPDYQTNFFAWSDPLQFFTNAADRLLRATFTDAKANLTNFGVASVLSLTNIPVLISNRFAYTPGMHRILQVTANIWDASTNRVVPRGPTGYPYLPSVFRPIFRTTNNPYNPSITDIYICGYREVGALNGGTSDPQLAVPKELNDPADLAAVITEAASSTQNINIYGVPWVIGAKKGFPNFNEFAMQSVAGLTRKLQVIRPSTSAPPNATNQLFVIGISNTFAFEAWNSYQTAYNRDVQVVVANDLIMGFNYTNDVPLDMGLNGVSTVRTNLIAVTNIAANGWPGYGRLTSPNKGNFVVPMQTNITFLPDSYFRTQTAPTFSTNMNDRGGLVKGFEQTGRFPIPQFYFGVSNRIRVIMIDQKTQRIVDYVQLDDLNRSRNLSSEILESTTPLVVDGAPSPGSEAIFFRTNRVGGNIITCPPEGVINQINASLGELNVRNWFDYGINQASGALKDKAIDDFRVFMGLTPLKFPGTLNTNIEMQVPFTPTRRTSQTISWQANDPLVHYTSGDLAYLDKGDGFQRENPSGGVAVLGDIQGLNGRFQPWGGNPAQSTLKPSIPQYSLEAKDPGVKTSDNWDFPTNSFGTLGLLGRVHRGTPWQTVYLKANDINISQWTNWTGNVNFVDATASRPVMDRVLVDVFTTAIDQSSTRGQFNVNQGGVAALSALLGGVIGLTNASTDDELLANPPIVRLEPFIIDPAGKDLSGPTNSVLGKIHDAMDRTRAAAPFNGSFKHLGDILAVPELTTASPLLNTNGTATFPKLRLENGINDAVYERLPQQLLGLMRGGDQPSFTIYAYGQTLHPANRSIVTSGPFFGLCTNYQITAEFATRSVVRIEGAPSNPKAVVDSFNVLPPE